MKEIEKRLNRNPKLPKWHILIEPDAMLTKIPYDVRYSFKLRYEPTTSYKAFRNINDLNLLNRIALHSKYYEIRSLAVAYINDQEMLAKIAINEKDHTSVFAKAMLKLKDPELIINVVMQNPSRMIHALDSPIFGIYSSYNLLDKSHLLKLAIESTNDIISKRAAGHITDNDLRTQIALQAIKL